MSDYENADIQTIPLDKLAESLRNQIKGLPREQLVVTLMIGALARKFDEAVELINAQHAALQQLNDMVSNVLTDSQLDHEQCGTTIRRTLSPVEEVLAKWNKS